MKAAARLMLVAALMTSIGLHWVVMQSAAWVGMAVTYSVQSGSVFQGLSETFDGAHPCPLCHAVSEGTKDSSSNESAPAKVIKDLKVDWVLEAAPVFVFIQPMLLNGWKTADRSAILRPGAPAAPPPRRGGIA